MPIFEKHELSQEYNLYKDRLPTVNDVLKYVLSRWHLSSDRNGRVREVSKKTYELWEKADCCPLSLQRIQGIYQQVYDKYVTYLKKSGNSNHRKRISSSPPPQPSRRSSRSPAQPISKPKLQTPPPNSPSVPSVSTRNQPDNSIVWRKKWDEEVGNQLLDVLDQHGVVDAVKKGKYFDRAFYIDQLGPRKTVMQVTKVTNEFRCAEENRKRKEARIYAREQSARGTGMFQFVNLGTENDKETTITTDEREDQDTHNDFIHTPIGYSSIIKTRRNIKHHASISTAEKSCQISESV